MRKKIQCKDCGSVNYTVHQHCNECSGDLKQEDSKDYGSLLQTILGVLTSF